ncbi:MAG: hypothetical protein ABSC05_05995 [Candidatus Solibacter sp.]
MAMFAAKANPAVDPNNVAPPTGAILDLNGTPIPHTFQSYSVSFVANLTSTAITFAFREDPAFLSLEQVTVVDQTVSGPNLLTNGDFSGGTNGGTAVGWTYANIYGASAGGVVNTSGCGGPQPAGACWYDGAVQAYDAISQNVTTVVGHTYKISFYLSDNGPYSTFSSLSTNGNVTGTGGNGVDVLVYAQAGLPAAAGATSTANAAPALSTGGLFLLGLLLAAAGWVQVRRSLHASS